MISLAEYINDSIINEWKEDIGKQVIIIIGTPGCGKTYWMQHNGIKFFQTQGIKLNPKELDVDHTLKYFQLLDFPKFCKRLIEFGTTTILDKNGKDVHNNDKAWKTFIDNETERYTELNKSNGGLETNIPNLSLIEYKDLASYISRYEKAQESKKESVLNEFIKFMSKKYFDKVFASDFSVRGEAKEQYNKNLIEKIIGDADVFAALSGAKFSHIQQIADLCKENNITLRLVYLNGSVKKAVYQDDNRSRSGGANFVIDYAKKIENVWNEMINPSSDTYYKKHNIYTIYEFTDTNENDFTEFPNWKLKKIYK